MLKFTLPHSNNNSLTVVLFFGNVNGCSINFSKVDRNKKSNRTLTTKTSAKIRYVTASKIMKKYCCVLGVKHNFKRKRFM